MIKNLLLTTIIAVGTVIPGVSDVGTGHHVVYYIPHQDDEILNFGSSIYHHVQAGHTVHLVLLTDGSATVVGKRLGLTKEEVTKARNREFFRSATILGIHEDNIYYVGHKDGELTVEQSKQVMKEFAKKYPSASHKAYTYTDWHNDHRNSGLALKELLDEGVIEDARFYIRRGENPEGIQKIRAGYKDEYFPFLYAASMAYKIENEQTGMYGIGWKSAHKSFERMFDDPINYYHK